MKSEIKKPSLVLSVSIVLGMLLFLALGVTFFKMDIISALMICFVAVMFASMKLGYSINELFEMMGKSLKNATMSLYFFFLIGMLMAMWIAAGTIPSLIYFGLNSINPSLFLPLGFIACCIVSFVTGTSWGTAGTIGVALLGMGMGMGINPAIIAGMVVSGAAFGDYCSPLSETTVLTSQSAGVDLYAHVKSMWKTMIPTFVISVIVFGIIGAQFNGNETGISTQVILETLNSNFNISIITLIPIIVVLVLSAFKLSTVPTLLIGIGLGFLVAIITQQENPIDLLNMLNYGYSLDSGNDMVNTLVNRGGIQSMMWTFSLAVISILLSGMLEQVGYLRTIISVFISKIKTTPALMIITYISGVLGCMAMAEVYLSIILNGSLYKDVYDEKGVDRSVLSRTIEEGATLAGPLVPWTTSGAFLAGTLGVSSLAYAKFAAFNLISPIVSIALALFGIAICKSKFGKEKKLNLKS